jgi:hypothetical protein
MDLPFDLWTIIGTYMCATESLYLRSTSKSLNIFLLQSKELQYVNLFKQPVPLASVRTPILQYMKIIDNVNSLDVFTVYDTLLWAIKHGFVDFLKL